MVPRSYWPYVGVIGLGVVFVSVAVYGLATLSGAEGLGVGIGRVTLFLILLVGSLGVIVAGVDLLRHHSSAE